MREFKILEGVACSGSNLFDRGKDGFRKNVEDSFLDDRFSTFCEFGHKLQTFLFARHFLVVVHFLTKARVFVVKNGEGVAVELCPLNDLGGTKGSETNIFSNCNRLKKGRVVGGLNELGGNVRSNVNVSVIEGYK